MGLEKRGKKMQLGTVTIIATALTALSAGTLTLSGAGSVAATQPADANCVSSIHEVLSRVATSGALRLTETVTGDQDATNVIVTIPGVGRHEINSVDGEVQRELLVLHGDAWEWTGSGGWQELPKLRTLSEVAAVADINEWTLDGITDASCAATGAGALAYRFSTKSAHSAETWTVRADMLTRRPVEVEAVAMGAERITTRWTFDYDPTLTISPPTIHL